MSISSRTPEGLPQRCPVCGNVANIEPSLPAGDSCCPSCGQLLWWLRDRLSSLRGDEPDSVLLSDTLADLDLGSLDIVELVMEFEEEFDVTISDETAAELRTIADVLRYLQWRRNTNEDG